MDMRATWKYNIMKTNVHMYVTHAHTHTHTRLVRVKPEFDLAQVKLKFYQS